MSDLGALVNPLDILLSAEERLAIQNRIAAIGGDGYLYGDFFMWVPESVREKISQRVALLLVDVRDFSLHALTLPPKREKSSSSF
jgi:hypothetical protein